MENHANPPSAVQIHLQRVLQQEGNQPRAVRMVGQRKIRWWPFDRKVEKIRLRKTMLSSVHQLQINKLQNSLYLPSTKGRFISRQISHVQKLWLQRLFKSWLIMKLMILIKCMYWNNWFARQNNYKISTTALWSLLFASTAMLLWKRHNATSMSWADADLQLSFVSIAPRLSEEPITKTIPVVSVKWTNTGASMHHRKRISRTTTNLKTLKKPYKPKKSLNSNRNLNRAIGKDGKTKLRKPLPKKVLKSWKWNCKAWRKRFWKDTMRSLKKQIRTKRSFYKNCRSSRKSKPSLTYPSNDIFSYIVITLLT